MDEKIVLIVFGSVCVYTYVYVTAGKEAMNLKEGEQGSRHMEGFGERKEKVEMV